MVFCVFTNTVFVSTFISSVHAINFAYPLRLSLLAVTVLIALLFWLSVEDEAVARHSTHAGCC